MNTLLQAGFCALVTLAACQRSNISAVVTAVTSTPMPAPVANPRLVLNSGFGGSTQIVTTSNLQFYQSIRLYLPADFNTFTNGTVPGSGDWITLFEYWNNASWMTNAQYSFRTSVNLDKAAAVAGSPQNTTRDRGAFEQ